MPHCIFTGRKNGASSALAVPMGLPAPATARAAPAAVPAENKITTGSPIGSRLCFGEPGFSFRAISRVSEPVFTAAAEEGGGLRFAEQASTQDDLFFRNGPGQLGAGKGRWAVGDEDDILALAIGAFHGNPSFSFSIPQG